MKYDTESEHSNKVEDTFSEVLFRDDSVIFGNK